MNSELLWGVVDPDGRRWVIWSETRPTPVLGMSLEGDNGEEEAYFEAGTYTVLDEPFTSTDAADAWIERRDEE